jgi:hypothetical protein
VLERADTGRQVQYRVRVARGIGDGDGVEEVELLAHRHRELMAGRVHERTQRTAEHAGSPSYQQPHPRPLARFVASCGLNFGSHGIAGPGRWVNSRCPPAGTSSFTT